jgi:hypothetical protein
MLARGFVLNIAPLVAFAIGSNASESNISRPRLAGINRPRASAAMKRAEASCAG